MAYPKTKEELKIYKELLEKYKDDQDVIEAIEQKRDDETNHESWETMKIWCQVLSGEAGVLPIGTIAMMAERNRNRGNK